MLWNYMPYHSTTHWWDVMDKNEIDHVFSGENGVLDTDKSW